MYLGLLNKQYSAPIQLIQLDQIDLLKYILIIKIKSPLK